MKENKYWWIILILEMIFFLMFIDFVKELKIHGFYFLSNILGILAFFLYLFFS